MFVKYFRFFSILFLVFTLIIVLSTNNLIRVISLIVATSIFVIFLADIFKHRKVHNEGIKSALEEIETMYGVKSPLKRHYKITHGHQIEIKLPSRIEAALKENNISSGMLRECDIYMNDLQLKLASEQIANKIKPWTFKIYYTALPESIKGGLWVTLFLLIGILANGL